MTTEKKGAAKKAPAKKAPAKKAAAKKPEKKPTPEPAQPLALLDAWRAQPGQMRAYDLKDVGVGWRLRLEEQRTALRFDEVIMRDVEKFGTVAAQIAIAIQKWDEIMPHWQTLPHVVQRLQAQARVPR